LPEKKWFGHLAIFWPFFYVDKNSIFQGFVLTNLSKFRTVYEILNFYLVILTKYLKKIWPLFGLFSFFRIWPFLKLLMAKFGLFNFFGPGNPELRRFQMILFLFLQIRRKHELV